MIVVDANLLIYSYDADAIDHVKSSAWVAKVFSGTESVGLPWQTVTAFLRVVTNRRLPGKRVTLQEAIVAVEEWLEQPNVRILAPGENHWPLLKQLIVEGAASGPLVTDAQLAVFAIEYGGVLYTADQDFARFPGLQWVNPLI